MAVPETLVTLINIPTASRRREYLWRAHFIRYSNRVASSFSHFVPPIFVYEASEMVAAASHENGAESTTSNKSRVEPFRYCFRNQVSAQTDSAMPSRAVVSPAYRVFLRIIISNFFFITSPIISVECTSFLLVNVRTVDYYPFKIG